MAAMAGLRQMPMSSGSTPVWFQIHQVRNAATTIIAPCARLMTFMTPKTRVNPDDMSAYTPPASRPRISVCRRSVMCGLPRSVRWSLPVRLRVEEVRVRAVLGCDDLQLARLELREQELTLRATGRVPAQRADDRLDRVL